MNPESQLTSGQVRFFVGLWLVLIFCISGYAWLMLARSHPKEQKSVAPPVRRIESNRPLVVVPENQPSRRIACGQKGQATLRVASSTYPQKQIWQIVAKSRLLADDEVPQGWNVTESGLITVPPNVIPGLYEATYFNHSCQDTRSQSSAPYCSYSFRVTRPEK